MRALIVAVMLGLVATAYAQPSVDPSSDPSLALREANAAATAGDWQRVAAFVQPLLSRQLDRADLAEAHRLAGIAALFAQPADHAGAEQHFVAYLRIDVDAHLDPALYPPEVVNFFNDVRARHAAELKALRPKSKRYAVLAVLPPFGQFQNGDKVKGIVIGSMIGAFAITNVTTFFMLRSWCFKQNGPGGTSIGCDGETAPSTNHNASAATLRGLNITAGVGLILTYAYGVYDGIRGYRRDTRERSLVPYASSSNGMSIVGVHMNF
ncbi:MAG TPA: hypothetical protein VIV40_33250 [Kofleriaceae bacterium]